MPKQTVQCAVSPDALEYFPDVLERIGTICRHALVEAGCTTEVDGVDLTTWDFRFVPEHFDPDIGEIIPEAFHIGAVAPMGGRKK